MNDNIQKSIMIITPHTPSLIWFRMDMLEGFMKNGYQVIAVGEESEEEWKQQFEEKGIVYRKIQIFRNGLNPLQDLKTVWEIRKLYKEYKPSKVFLYQAKAVVYGSIASRYKKEIETYSLISGLGSIFRGETRKSKVLRSIMKIEYRFALKKNKAVIFQNRDDMEQFQKWKLVKEQQCHIVNGSGVNMLHFRKEQIPSGTAFLMIGRIIRDKGIMEYLEASKIIKEKYPQVQCMLVGAYDTNPSAIHEEEIEMYWTSVDYYGEQSDVRPFLKRATVFVLPSYHEGTPKSVLEAMSTGRAIITTDVPGCRETVQEGKNGFLVRKKDVKDLVEKMEYFILHPEKQHEMGEYSRMLAEEKYDVNKVNMRINQIMNL